MRNRCILNAKDMTDLFLYTARIGMGDMALLLAKQVPDLTVQNMWGENALTMAAKMVC